MDDLSATKVLAIMRQVNQRLSLRLGSLRSNQEQVSNMTLEMLESLMDDLAEAAACLRCLPAEQKRPLELRREFEIYRRNLQSLESVLPHLHRQLLIERARLGSATNQNQAALSWVRTSKMTIERQ
jgi:hypothetical protein